MPEIPKKKGHEKFIARTILSDPPRRLRKNQHGNSNLAATTHLEHFSIRDPDGYRDPTKILKHRESGEFKYVINKLLDKDAPFRPLQPDPKKRAVHKLSVWNHRDGDKDDIQSTHEVDYHAAKLLQGSPREVLQRREILRSAPHVSAQRVQQRNEAFGRFRSVVSSHFADGTAMFKACKKTKEDTIDHEEFANLMLRLNLDASFPVDDQQLLLESLPRIHGAGVSISDFILKIDSPQKLSPVAHFKCEPVYIGTRGISVPEAVLAATQKRRELERSIMESNTMQLSTNNHPLTSLQNAPNGLSSIASDTYRRQATKASTESLAGYLQMSNMDMEKIPFYDRRAEGLNWRRHRASLLEEAAQDPKVQERLAEWEGRKRMGDELHRLQDAARAQKVAHMRFGAVDDFIHPLGPKSKFSTWSGKQRATVRAVEDDLSVSSVGSQHDDSPSKGVQVQYHSGGDGVELGVGVGVGVGGRGGGGGMVVGGGAGGARGGAQNAALKLADKAAAKAATRKAQKSLAPDATVGNDGTSIGSTEDTYLSAGLGKTNYIYDSTEASHADFYPQMPSRFSTKTKLDDPSMILMMEPTFSEVPQRSTAKRMAPRGPLDFSRVGVGSNATCYDSPGSVSAGSPVGSPMGGSNNQGEYGKQTIAQQSTTSAYFPPFIYEPSKPIARDLVSDSEKEMVQRKLPRNARYERGMKNFEGTLKRLADFEFDQKVKELFNVKARNESVIRYEATVLEGDLRAFRGQALQSMSKKASQGLSVRMWGGAEGAVNDSMVNRDERDFATTHQSSYFDNSSVRRSTGKLLMTGH